VLNVQPAQETLKFILAASAPLGFLASITYTYRTGSQTRRILWTNCPAANNQRGQPLG